VGHPHHGDHVRTRVRSHPLVRPDMNVADILELLLAFALLVYLVYVLIRPERF